LDSSINLRLENTQDLGNKCRLILLSNQLFLPPPRAVTIKGPRGSLTKSFKHLAVDIYMTDKETIKVEKWFGKKKQLAAVRTVCSHITNMFTGVTKGYLYKMRAVYAHFPINCAITEGGTLIEVRNFLGEKFIRKVRMHPGVTVENSKAQKDELIVQGKGTFRYYVNASLNRVQARFMQLKDESSAIANIVKKKYFLLKQ